MRNSPFRRPRRYLRLACVLAVGYAAWLLLVPITVDYRKIGYDVTVTRTLYSWWSNHNSVIGFGLGDPTGGEVAEYVLLDCGNSFAAGGHEQEYAPDGPASCSSVETPRRFVGIGLAVLGVAGFLVAGRLPAKRRTLYQ
jgi:hypothetical protein